MKYFNLNNCYYVNLYFPLEFLKELFKKALGRRSLTVSVANTNTNGVSVRPGRERSEHEL